MLPPVPVMNGSDANTVDAFKIMRTDQAKELVSARRSSCMADSKANGIIIENNLTLVLS